MTEREGLEIVRALDELERERGVPKAVLLEALEAALVSAFKRHYGSSQNVRVNIDPETGRILVLARKNVVEEAEDPKTEISLEEARQIDPNYELGCLLYTSRCV